MCFYINVSEFLLVSCCYICVFKVKIAARECSVYFLTFLST